MRRRRRWLRLLRWLGLAPRPALAGHGRIIDMSRLITMLDPDTTPFASMLDKLSTKPGYVYRWTEDVLIPRVVLWGDWRWVG